MADQTETTATGEPIDWQAFWIDEIARSEREMEPWRDRCRTILARYKQAKVEGSKAAWARPFPLLWSNIETQKETIYSRPPVANVSRRNRKQNPVARVASKVLESSTNYFIGASKVHETFCKSRDDFLLLARGQAWVRYVPEFGTQDMPVSLDPATGEVVTQPVQVIVNEDVAVDYLHYKDFGHSVARVWSEVWFVYMVAYLTKEEGEKQFGEAFADVGLDHKRDEDNEKRDDTAKARIYHIWSKRHGKVFTIAANAKEPLAIEDPPIKFDGFFPCPEPIFGTLTNDDLIPTPDYVYYQDQDDQINMLVKRVHALLNALKMIGFTPGASDDAGIAQLSSALARDKALQVVAVPSWAAFTDRGGAGKMIEWLPVKDVVATITSCIDAIEVLKGQVYETTGISDIMRGSTDPNETLGAQNLKAQWGTARVRPRQAAMARFCRDVCRLVAEVLAEAFQTETLARISEEEITPEVEALLRDDMARDFVIGVETDSTIQPNEDLEKQRRVEFGGMLAQTLPVIQNIVQTTPVLAPLAGELFKFLVRGFRTGAELEEVIEQAVEQVTQMAGQAQAAQAAGMMPPPGVDPSAMPQAGPVPPQQMVQQ